MTMAHLSTLLVVFAPTSRDGGRDIEMSPHDPVDFPCGNNSIGRVNVHPLAGVDQLPRRHRVEISTAHHLRPFDVHARYPPSANTIRHRPRLPMQPSYETFQALSNAVDRNRGCEPDSHHIAEISSSPRKRPHARSNGLSCRFRTLQHRGTLLVERLTCCARPKPSLSGEETPGGTETQQKNTPFSNQYCIFAF